MISVAVSSRQHFSVDSKKNIENDVDGKKHFIRFQDENAVFKNLSGKVWT